MLLLEYFCLRCKTIHRFSLYPRREGCYNVLEAVRGLLGNREVSLNSRLTIKNPSERKIVLRVRDVLNKPYKFNHFHL